MSVVSATRAFAIVAVLAALPVLAGCSESAQAGDTGGESQDDGRRPAAERATNGQTGGNPSGETKRTAHERSEDAKVRVGGDTAQAGHAVGGAGESATNTTSGQDAGKEAGGASRGGGVSSQKVVLEVEGSDGKRFTGTCSVGDEEQRIDGQTPGRYTFGSDGTTLECEIREDGPGTLRIVLAAEDHVCSVQQSGAGESNVSLSYSEGGISVSQSSSSESVSRVESTSSSEISSHGTNTR